MSPSACPSATRSVPPSCRWPWPAGSRARSWMPVRRRSWRRRRRRTCCSATTRGARTGSPHSAPGKDHEHPGGRMTRTVVPEELLPHDGHGRVRLLFTPSGREVRVPPGVTVFDAASWNGIAIDSTCGGHGTCRKCLVRIEDGAVPVSTLDVRAFSADQLRDGWRLACRAQAMGDLRVDVPPLVTRPKAATVGVGRQVILRPAIQKRLLKLEAPTLADQTSDLDRVLAALDDLSLRVDLPVLRTLGATLRANDYRVTAVVVDDVLIDVEPGDTTERCFGLAFDLGTTTVVASL